MSAEQLQQVAILAGPLEACSLNGKPARLETAQRNKRTTFRVIASDGHSAVFNPSVIWDVIVRQGGKFHTRETRRSEDAGNYLEAARVLEAQAKETEEKNNP